MNRIELTDENIFVEPTGYSMKAGKDCYMIKIVNFLHKEEAEQLKKQILESDEFVSSFESWYENGFGKTEYPDYISHLMKLKDKAKKWDHHDFEYCQDKKNFKELEQQNKKLEYELSDTRKSNKEFADQNRKLKQFYDRFKDDDIPKMKNTVIVRKKIIKKLQKENKKYKQLAESVKEIIKPISSPENDKWQCKKLYELKPLIEDLEK